MARRRQLLAAGLLLAVLAGPVWALPAARPGTAEAGTAASASSAPTTLDERVYLPQFTIGVIYDLAVSKVEIIQSVTMGDSYTVHVAGRPALLRVFVTLGGGDSLVGVSARVRRFVGGVQQNQLTAGPQTVYAATNEGNLTHTFNFNLPASWLTTSSSYVVELDHANAIPETNESNNRYPATGVQSFNAVNLAALNVVIVPVTYKGTTPPTADLSYLTWMPMKVFPVAQINYTVRAPYNFTGNLQAANGSGWSQLLGEIHQIHGSENPAGDKLYFGLVDSVAADGCNPSCITGIGYISQPGIVWKTSAGFAGFPGSTSGRNQASPTFTHEMGHNFGRRHAPCGNPSGVDGSFPYAGAIIGQWGYDTSNGAFYPPSYNDYMSYCGPEWTSDYTYHGIAQSWGWLNAAVSAAMSAAEATPGVVVSGYLGPDGSLHVDPVFRAEAVSAFQPPADNRMELLDASGGVLASVPFALTEVIIEAADYEARGASFRVQAPLVEGLSGFRLFRGDELIYERLASGAAPALDGSPAFQTFAPDGSLQVGWQLTAGSSPPHFRVRFSPDGGDAWSVMALDTPSAQFSVPAELLASATAPVLEVQASDGVRTDIRVFPLTSATANP